MSKKYIQEYQNNNFVYPNNDPWEYGVDIIHNINNNSVSGTVSNFTSVLSGGNLVFTFDYSWALNGAEPFINDAGQLSILSVHMMDNINIYHKPWRLVYSASTTLTGSTTVTNFVNQTVTPAMMGVTGFTEGNYFFEVRMIGKREIFPICVEVAVTPGPTPTPIPCYCYPIVVTGTTGGEGGIIANITYNNCAGELIGSNYTVGPGTYKLCIQTVDTVVQYFTASGIDVSYLTIPGVGNCNTGYACTGYTPADITPTPTPTVTPTNGYVPPTPTPTPTRTVTPTPTPTNGYVAPTPTPTSSSVPVTTPTPTPTSITSVRIDWFLAMAAGARLTVTNNVSATLLDETSTGGSSRSGTIYVPVSQLPYTVTGWWNSGSGNIVRYNICDLGSGGEYYSSGAIDIIVDSESVLVSPTPLYIGINVVGNDTTPPTCPS